MRRLLALLLSSLLALLLVGALSAGCSLLLDLEECENDEDCARYGKVCDDGVCVPR